MRRRAGRIGPVAALVAGLLLTGIAGGAERIYLPAGTDFGDGAPMRPREVSASEAAGGRQSDLAALGRVLFNSPGLLGEPARSLGISCQTCHTAGHANQQLVVPGFSRLPGTIDVSSSLFNALADDHAFNPIRIPSLRGIRDLAPYGREGRVATLPAFVRKVIVEEFAGGEPSKPMLNALVAYLSEIDFLPNPRLGPAGRLADPASAAERRGEALFGKPFAAMGDRSCASCHPPAELFIDRRRHDVASDGVFKTPTLLGLDFRAPYFHDGRYASLDEAVAHFDRAFGLGLSSREIRDLVAYLEAIGDASAPEVPDSVAGRMIEIEAFCATLDGLVAARDYSALGLAVDTIVGKLRALGERFPGPAMEPARAATAALAAELEAIERLAEGAGPENVRPRLAGFLAAIRDLGPKLESFEAQSLFNPARSSARYASVEGVEVLRGN